MSRIENIQNKVAALYAEQNFDGAEWLPWAYENHVCVVAKNASRLSAMFGANEEFSVAGALLHDIADTVIDRNDDTHEEKSIDIAKTILLEEGFSEKDIEFILKEVIAPHSCSDVLPTTLEGKVLATADGMSHFQTSFYMYFAWQHWGKGGEVENFEEFKDWANRKIEKDFNKKIFFEEIKKEIEPFYKALQLFLS